MVSLQHLMFYSKSPSFFYTLELGVAITSGGAGGREDTPGEGLHMPGGQVEDRGTGNRCQREEEGVEGRIGGREKWSGNIKGG